LLTFPVAGIVPLLGGPWGEGTLVF
jgi:hypothetical protein